MRNLVACTYILGTAMTMVGVLHAYRRARRQKRALDSIKPRSDALTEPTPVDYFEAGLSDDASRTLDLRVESEKNRREIERLLREAGIVDPPPSYSDMQLPVSYWSRRAALTDTLLEFKADGALALGGVVVSTVASVWSVYV